MIEIMTVGDILNTPKGIAIGGRLSVSSPTQSLEKSIKEMEGKTKNMDSILYKDKNGNYRKLKIKESDFRISVRDTINLFFLLGNIKISEEIKEGTTIYRAEK